MVFALWLFLNISGWFELDEVWSVVNAIHTISTFVFFHWIKGNPDGSSQGEYNGLTVYEQIQAGIPYTKFKKFLMIIPALITWR